MIYTAYYNQNNEILIISSDNTITDSKVIDEDTYFYNGDQLVGANIHIKDLEPGLIDLSSVKDKRIEKFVNEEHPFLYGLIKTCEDHPNSDHLHICNIEDGKSKQIVCGAKNCQANKIAIVAQIGTIMPSGIAIRPSQLVKVDSEGMLCSLKELGKVQISDGIFLTDNDELIGKAFY